ncbi:hypothetical protein [Nostoc sp. PCC 7524]|nr:hypothetical protein [Nostoc sp. PCC 7524]
MSNLRKSTSILSWIGILGIKSVLSGEKSLRWAAMPTCSKWRWGVLS